MKADEDQMRINLGLLQLPPTSMHEYTLAEHLSSRVRDIYVHAKGETSEWTTKGKRRKNTRKTEGSSIFCLGHELTHKNEHQSSYMHCTNRELIAELKARGLKVKMQSSTELKIMSSIISFARLLLRTQVGGVRSKALLVSLIEVDDEKHVMSPNGKRRGEIVAEEITHCSKRSSQLPNTCHVSDCQNDDEECQNDDEEFEPISEIPFPRPYNGAIFFSDDEEDTPPDRTLNTKFFSQGW